MHAGAVGIGGRGVLLAGPSGSGKSTSAVAAVLAGHDYVGDDYVMVELTGSDPIAHSLYRNVKLAPAAAAFLPEFAGAFAGRLPSDADKHVIDVSQFRPGAVRESIAIVAIVLPRLRPGGTSALRRTSASAALLALAPTTVLHAPQRDGAAIRSLCALARRVPAFVLELAGATDQVGPILARLLDENGRS